MNAKDISERFGWKFAKKILDNVLNSMKIDSKVNLDTSLTGKINLIKYDIIHGSTHIAINALNIFFEEIDQHPEKDNLWFGILAGLLIEAKPVMASLHNIINYTYKELVKSREKNIRFTKEEILLLVGRATEEVVEKAYFDLSQSEVFHTILTCSYSNLVVKFFEYAKIQGDDFKVLIYQSKVNNIDYSEKLKSELEYYNIDSTIISANEIQCNIENISFFITGADCFDNEGNVVNGTPTLEAAIACEILKVPYYILAESYKRLDISATDSGFDLIKSKYITKIFSDDFDWN